MTGVIQSTGLPADVQDLLRRYMPTFVGENAVVLGGGDHMRVIFVGPPDADGKPVPRCAIDLNYEVAAGLAASIGDVLAKRPA